MSHVVTRYSWTWRATGGAEYEGDPITDIMTWVGEMSEVGWELKGLTTTMTTHTDHRGVHVQTPILTAFMQRPLSTANGLEAWEYPG